MLLFDRLELAWHLGDRITVLDADGQLLNDFGSAGDVETQAVQLGAPTPGQAKRLYVTLETGPAFQSDPGWHFQPRTFRLTGLNAIPSEQAPSALIVDDDIDYDTTAAFLDAYYFDAFNQNKQPLYPPWWSDNIHSPAGQRACPKPSQEQGWYLLGKNVHMPGPGFFELVYYNEITSQLRLYLFNISLSRDVSLFNVEVGLRGKTKGENNLYEELKGAFFPLDPNPKNWSAANVTLPDWPVGTWVYFDLDILYPMAETLPLVDVPLYLTYPSHPGAAVKPQAYVSVYEENLKKGYRNITLYTRIRGYQTGVLSGDFIGEAAGDALQVFGQSSPYEFKKVATAVSDGISKGYNWYDSADKFYTKVEDYSKKNPGGTVAGFLAPILSLGAAAFSGPLAAAGFAVSLLGSALFNKPEPIRLSLQLSLHGTFTGKSVTPAQTTEWWFYLPGSYSIEEAFTTTGLPTQDLAQIDSRLPRYDRTIGLFGYLYNPGRVELDAFARCSQNSAYEWEYSDVVFPARHSFDVDLWSTYGLLEAGRGHDPRVWPSGQYDPSLAQLCKQQSGKGDIWVGGKLVNCQAILEEAKKPRRSYYLTALDSFGSPQITEILPVVYNPYAGIIPVTATRLPSGLPSDYERDPAPHECSALELRVYPSAANSVLESNQVRLYFHPVGGPLPGEDLELSRTCQDPRVNGKQGFGFLVIADPSEVDTELAPLEYATAYKIGRHGLGYSVTPINTMADDVRNWYRLWIGTHARPAWDPFPLHDAVMTWEVKYWKKNRDSALPAQLKASHMSAPITFNMMWVQGCGGPDPAAVKSCVEHTAHLLPIESELLRKVGSPHPSP